MKEYTYSFTFQALVQESSVVKALKQKFSISKDMRALQLILVNTFANG